MHALSFATITELRKKIQSKELSAQEVLEFFVQRMQTHNPQLGALLEIFEKESILSSVHHEGTLFGIPGVMKDNINQNNRRLSCASKILDGFIAAYDATATMRLKKEGAFIAGRANMDEFAMGSSNETSAFYPARNPWDTSRVPGGSSGGSAVSVASGLVPWALGTDTGGSVRQPAALCGIVGLKPTYGLISRYGIVAYASSLDQIGVFTRTVYDNALVLSAIAGNDPHDSSTLPIERRDYTAGLTHTLPAGLRIGVVENALHAPGMNAEIVASIEEAIAQLKKLGASIRHVQLPTIEYSAATYFIISRAEAASNLARFDGVRYGLRNREAKNLSEMYANTRHDGFGPEVKSRILVGNYVLSAGYSGAFYQNAKRVQRMISHEFTNAFKEVDLLIMPTHPEPAFKIGQYENDPLKIDLQDYFTCSINLAGIPAISMPCGFTKESLPIGFQLVGSHASEHLVYQVAHAYEQATPWHTQHPTGF